MAAIKPRVDPANALPTWLACLQHQGAVPSTEVAAELCGQGCAELLATLVSANLQTALREVHIQRFWNQLRAYNGGSDDGSGAWELERLLLLAMEELSAAAQAQAHQLASLVQQLLAAALAVDTRAGAATAAALLQVLPSQPHAAVAAALLSSAPLSLTDLLQRYYGDKLTELGDAMRSSYPEDVHGNWAGFEADDASDAGACEPMDVAVDGGGQHGAANAEHRGAPGAALASAAGPAMALMGAEWCARLRRVAQLMASLGLEAASEEAYTLVVHNYVSAQLSTGEGHELHTRMLRSAQRIATAPPCALLAVLLGADESTAAASRLHEWRLRLSYLLYEALGRRRIAAMFDAIIDFPDSAPAIADVAECMRHTNLQAEFVAGVRGAVEARLLHAGAATADIISTYVATIKALAEIDATGALLAAVSAPIRAYLRSRPDAIRCIVSMLTGEGAEGGETVLEELEAAGTGGAGGGTGGSGVAAGAFVAGSGGVSEAEGDELALRHLEALDAGGAGVGGAGTAQASAAADGEAPADVVSLLIGIYGSKDLFINEYQAMLAERLLAQGRYDCEREVRSLELLKIRFGEAALHHCDVMVRDLATSKRINTTIHQQPPPRPTASAPATPTPGTAATPVEGACLATPASGGAPLSPTAAAAAERALGQLHATIASHLYWPELQQHELKVPSDVATALQAYGERYHHLKAPRKLLWRHTLGLVELRVCLGGQTLEFRVTPLHACLLLAFRDADALSASELAARVGAPAGVVRRKALFWVTNGLLLETRTPGAEVVYRAAEVLDPAKPITPEATDVSWQDDTAAGAASAEERLLADMAPFENFVIGLLSSFQALPLERMHSLLRVFVVGEPKYDRTQEQLSGFLAVLVSRGKVVVEGGLYRRAPAAPAG